MPNATCFLIAYLLVLILETLRFASSSDLTRRWVVRVSVGMFLLAWLTHTLYLVDLVFQSALQDLGIRYLKTWADWSIVDLGYRPRLLCDALATIG